MSKKDIHTPAFPSANPDDEATGLTKLQWAAIQLAAAMIASGNAPEDIELVAARAAARILAAAAP